MLEASLKLQYHRRIFPLILLGLILFLFFPLSVVAEVSFSTATGNRMEFDDSKGVVIITGDAFVLSSSASLKADEIRLYSKEGRVEAEGNVRLIQEDSILEGSSAEYFWEASSGVIHDATGVSPPWRFSADRLHAKSKDVYQLKRAIITSCDHDPPHYRLRSNQGKITNRERGSFRNVRLIVDEAPVFWMPFYTRSLVPKKYTLRIEPGHTSRDGFTNLTVFGYPDTAAKADPRVSPNSRN